MKHVLSVLTFGIGALLFVAVFTTLTPTAVAVASGSGQPGQCDTKVAPAVACGSLIFATALWPDLGRHN